MLTVVDQLGITEFSSLRKHLPKSVTGESYIYMYTCLLVSYIHMYTCLLVSYIHVYLSTSVVAHHDM